MCIKAIKRFSFIIHIVWVCVILPVGSARALAPQSYAQLLQSYQGLQNVAHFLYQTMLYQKTPLLLEDYVRQQLEAISYTFPAKTFSDSVAEDRIIDAFYPGHIVKKDMETMWGKDKAKLLWECLQNKGYINEKGCVQKAFLRCSSFEALELPRGLGLKTKNQAAILRKELFEGVRSAQRKTCVAHEVKAIESDLTMSPHVKKEVQRDKELKDKGLVGDVCWHFVRKPLVDPFPFYFQSPLIRALMKEGIKVVIYDAVFDLQIPLTLENVQKLWDNERQMFLPQGSAPFVVVGDATSSLRCTADGQKRELCDPEYILQKHISGEEDVTYTYPQNRKIDVPVLHRGIAHVATTERLQQGTPLAHDIGILSDLIREGTLEGAVVHVFRPQGERLSGPLAKKAHKKILFLYYEEEPAKQTKLRLSAYDHQELRLQQWVKSFSVLENEQLNCEALEKNSAPRCEDFVNSKHNGFFKAVNRLEECLMWLQQAELDLNADEDDSLSVLRKDITDLLDQKIEDVRDAKDSLRHELGTWQSMLDEFYANLNDSGFSEEDERYVDDKDAEQDRIDAWKKFLDGLEEELSRLEKGGDTIDAPMLVMRNKTRHLSGADVYQKAA